MLENTLDFYKQLKQDYADVFASEKGGKVLKDLSSKAFLNNTTFSKDALEMAFREGQRSVLLHIQNMQNLDLDKIAKQIKANQKET